MNMDKHNDRHHDKRPSGHGERDNVKILQTSLNTSTSKDLRAETTYQLVYGADGDGNTVPIVLGGGRFAKVYKAWQRSSGHNVRPVAIKILHENIDKRSEQLFLQEIELLKNMTATKGGRNVIKILDILQLGPMAMCGSCGQIYHPKCPLCGEHMLERYDPPQDAHPALRCRNHSRCKYLVSGEHILNSSYALLQHPAKSCCAKEKGARAQRGTLINFVDRDAVVMELLDEGLPLFQHSRRRTYARLCRMYGVDVPGLIDEADEDLGEAQGPAPPLRPAEPTEVAFVQKVLLLEKMLVMVQLAESLAWLHGEQEIIHKDIAPDNIMVATLPELGAAGGDWRGLGTGGLAEALTSLANCPSITAKLIDFGLADHKDLTRNWYEEPVQNFANDKLSYLSLEARQRKRRIYHRFEFDLMTKQFLVPDSLRPDKAGELSLKVGDLLVDESDPSHYYCVEVTAIDKDPADGRIFRATYEGEVPPNYHSRQFDLVHRLGEAHDLYALGAVFYYTLTGEHTDVRKLTIIADLLQDAPQPLRGETLSRTVPMYDLCRDRIPEKFFQDELMILILRAMVRGQTDSFISSRIERSAEPARRLLHETRSLYNRLKADILSEPAMRRISGIEQQLESARRAHTSIVAEQQRTRHFFAQRQQRLFIAAPLLALFGFGGGWYLWGPRPHLSMLAPRDPQVGTPTALAQSDAHPTR